MIIKQVLNYQSAASICKGCAARSESMRASSRYPMGVYYRIGGNRWARVTGDLIQEGNTGEVGFCDPILELVASGQSDFCLVG